MIHFIIKIPFKRNDLKNMYYKEVSLSKNKFFSMEILKDTDYLVNISLEWTTTGDHAGLDINLGLLGYEVYLSIRDKRHWDYEKETWINY